jgi:beta-glucosidase
LNPGAKKEVKFKLNDRDLSVWDIDTHGWQVQNGEFKIYVGSSSRDIKAVGNFTNQPFYSLV